MMQPEKDAAHPEHKKTELSARLRHFNTDRGEICRWFPPNPYFLPWGSFK